METLVVTEVALEKSNVIEAGAGTGKTYSIAILVLRLILEKKVPVQEILMVTFTKAAVAELETRIREFIALAYQSAQGIPIEDETIRDIVAESINQQGGPASQQLLKDALALMDETSILTIHGFCQKTLQEFAFETNQVFGSEALSPEEQDEMSASRIHHYWRKYIAPLGNNLLKQINPHLKIDVLEDMLKQALSGKQFNLPITPRTPLLDSAHQQELLATIQVAERERDTCWDSLCDEFANNEPAYRIAIQQNATAKRYFTEIDDPNDIILEIEERKESKYISVVFPTILRGLDEWRQKKELVTKIQQQTTYVIFAQLTILITRDLEELKSKQSLLSFDDMIDHLHRAICLTPSTELINTLRTKYKAVFIDEFQDTDRKQYEIFHRLFGPPSETVVFMIGDPKQSIYAWRKADLFTYFKAVKEADKQFNMSVNYRSAASLIEAFNHFFLPEASFDTFYFQGSPDAFSYLPVGSPDPNDKGQLELNGEAVTPIAIHREAGNMYARVAKQVADLLSNPGYQINKKNQPRKITPADIAILVRNKFQAADIKDALNRFNIPSINRESEKVLKRPEALVLLNWLIAIESVTLSNINRALLSNITGYSIPQLNELDEEALVERFRDWNTSWKAKGVYVTLQSVFACFQLTNRLLQPSVESGERLLSNYIQLAEILHQTETRLQYRPAELISWLQKATEGDQINGDEYLQRIESDADAIQIITIHKSKGLEFNIVMAPFLEISFDLKSDTMTAYRDTNGDFFYGNAASFSDYQWQGVNVQQEQENRRLVYVSLTRARYKCYLFTNKPDTCNGTLAEFLSAITKNPSPFIQEVTALPQIPDNFCYQATARPQARFEQAANFRLKNTNWEKLSYSYLNPEHGARPISADGESAASKNAYDQFIFYQLRKGAFTGNLIHYLLEHIDFTKPGTWSFTINKALQRMSPGLEETHGEGLYQLIEQLCALALTAGNHTFTLPQISRNNQMAELEFNFPVHEFQTRQLMELSFPNTPFHLQKGKLWQGMMNGKIDFIGKQGEQFYVIDWKSNHLGYETDAYNESSLLEAMDANNYHLQYYIYLVALYKYLKGRISDFEYDRHIGGVFYLFVRGIRSGGSQGIFYRKPSHEQLLRFMNILSI
ncbi:MAG: UvrD-helicase domain-containing protein [Chitinophagia bacterium]